MNMESRQPDIGSDTSLHPVLFVGAGPGDPELITVKGQKALMAADVVIYAGSLVPEAILEWAGSETVRINSASMHLDAIVEVINLHYAAGKKIVRLHTGDPSLYGAIFEQMAELQRKAIPFSVIPGVTAAFAAAAAMGLEYTLPEISQTLILTRMAGRTPVPELESLQSLANHRTSMVIYLSIAFTDKVAAVLARAYGEDAACAVAFRVSQPGEKLLYTTVKNLAATVKKEGIARQALIIVGKVLDVRLDSLKHKSKLYDSGFAHGFRPTLQQEQDE